MKTHKFTKAQNLISETIGFLKEIESDSDNKLMLKNTELCFEFLRDYITLLEIKAQNCLEQKCRK